MVCMRRLLRSRTVRHPNCQTIYYGSQLAFLSRWLFTYMDQLYKWFDKKQEVVRLKPAVALGTNHFRIMWCNKRCLLGSSKAQELWVKILWGKWMCGKRDKDCGPDAAQWFDKIPYFWGKTFLDCDLTKVAYGSPLAFCQNIYTADPCM